MSDSDVNIFRHSTRLIQKCCLSFTQKVDSLLPPRPSPENGAAKTWFYSDPAQKVMPKYELAHSRLQLYEMTIMPQKAVGSISDLP